MTWRHIWTWLTTSPWDTVEYRRRSDDYIAVIERSNEYRADRMLELNAAIDEYKRRIEELATDYINVRQMVADRNRLIKHLSTFEERELKFGFHCGLCGHSGHEAIPPEMKVASDGTFQQACARCVMNFREPKSTRQLQPLRGQTK